MVPGHLNVLKKFKKKFTKTELHKVVQAQIVSPLNAIEQEIPSLKQTCDYTDHPCCVLMHHYLEFVAECYSSEHIKGLCNSRAYLF
jgi:hypothetical protein